MKLGIRKVKTWNGLMYGVVYPNVQSTKSKVMKGKDEDLKNVFKDLDDVGEDLVETKAGLALFPLTEEGLVSAHKFRANL